MEINITKDFCKRVVENKENTEMERILAAYALRLHNRIGKCENDANDLKNVIKSVVASIMKVCPWIIEQEAKNHGYKLVKDTLTPNEVVEKVFPIANPPFNGESSNED